MESNYNTKAQISDTEGGGLAGASGSESDPVMEKYWALKTDSERNRYVAEIVSRRMLIEIQYRANRRHETVFGEGPFRFDLTEEERKKDWDLASQQVDEDLLRSESVLRSRK